MKESEFRSKLLSVFNSAHNPGAFIWAHDAHFRSGFPDLYWVFPGSPYPHHAELKVVKRNETLPADPMTLCTKIQRYIMGKMAKTSAKVYLIVLHEQKSGSRNVILLPLHSGEASSTQNYDAFMRWWATLPNMIFKA